jgi:BlaI family penicillinase repressor
MKTRSGQASRPTLSKGEIAIIRALWEIGPAGVREVFENIASERTISYVTVQTYLRRLETKGYATSKLKGRARVYVAKVRPDAVIRQQVNDLLKHLFDGESIRLIRHLIEERGLSRKELNELKTIFAKTNPKDSRKP